MKIIKIEEYNYSIIYINDNEKYYMYKRIDETKWEVFHKNNWKQVTDYSNLEKLFKDKK